MQSIVKYQSGPNVDLISNKQQQREVSATHGALPFLHKEAAVRWELRIIIYHVSTLIEYTAFSDFLRQSCLTKAIYNDAFV